MIIYTKILMKIDFIEMESLKSILGFKTFGGNTIQYFYFEIV